MVYIPVLKRKISARRHDRNHLLCRCILHLISHSLKQAEAKPEGLRPLNVVVPADPHNQTEEWRHNMAAKIPNPKQFLSLKNDAKYDTFIKYFGKIISRVPFFRLILFDVSFNAVRVCRQNS